MVKFFFAEDTSKPKFTNKKGVMKQIVPVTLHVHRTDETTMEAVQLFARQVVLILHTCNDNEYWVALERLKPPTKGDGGKIQVRPIIYPTHYFLYRSIIFLQFSGFFSKNGLICSNL